MPVGAYKTKRVRVPGSKTGTRVVNAPEPPKTTYSVFVTYPNGRGWVHDFKSQDEALAFVKTMMGRGCVINCIWDEPTPPKL